MIRRKGITWAAIWVSRVVVGGSENFLDFWRISALDSVRRPSARKEAVLTFRSLVKSAVFVSPVMTARSRPPEGS